MGRSVRSSGVSSQEQAKKSKKNDEISDGSDSDEESEDWEEVEEAEIEDDEADQEDALANYKPQLPEQGVQISIDGPKIFNKKRRKKQVDVGEVLRQQLNRMKKEVQIEMHKTHLLCLLSRGFYLNHITLNPHISSFALSYLTDFTFDLKKVNLLFVRDFVNWFRSWFTLDMKSRPKAGDLVEMLIKAFETRSVNSLVEYVLMFLAVLRIYSPKIQMRLCYALNPVPIKPDDLIMTEKQQKGRKKDTKDKEESDEKSPDEPTTSQYFAKGKSKPASYKLYGEPSNKKTTRSTRASTSGKKRKKSSDDETDEEEKKPQRRSTRQSTTNGKGKKPAKKRRKSSEDEEEDEEFNPESDDDEDEKPKRRQSKGKGKGKGKQPAKKPKKETKSMISDDEGSDEIAVISTVPTKIVTEYWCEIFVDTEEKWICIDLENGTWDKPNEIEKKSHSPLLYVVSWDNFSHVKDVSQRYCSEYASCKFRRSRIDDDWWTETLSFFRPSRRTRQEKREDAELAQVFADRPMPTSLSDFKNHPLYVLKKHLLKYEVIYPPDAPILGKFRGEPIYARECVKDVHSREYWMRHARVVRPNEEPYKVSIKRKKWDKNLGDFLRDLPLDLFGEWQTDPYIPPDAKDGKVPRNQYGNVELFQPCMLPGGTVYLQLPGLIRIANKLKIDCAPAVTGFDNCSGGAGVHPVFDGFVVCEEFADTLREAWEEEQTNIKKREIEKREKRIYGNWKRLIKGVLIREQLRLKYNSGDQQPEDDVEMDKEVKPEPKASMTIDDIDRALSMFAKKKGRSSGQAKRKESTKKETKAKPNKGRSRKKKESSDEEEEDEDDFIVDDDEEIEEIELDDDDDEDDVETEIDFSDSD